MFPKNLKLQFYLSLQEKIYLTTLLMNFFFSHPFLIQLFYQIPKDLSKTMSYCFITI